MKESESESRQRQIALLTITALVLMGLLGAGLLVVGRALAQDTPQQQPVVRELIERVVAGDVITLSGEANIGFGFPFEQSLRKLAAEGALTHADVDGIMTDLASQTDAVTFSSTTSPDGQTKEVLIDVDIRSDDTTLRPAMEQALSNAVANGVLTAEQAAMVLTEVDAAPESSQLMLPGDVLHFESSGGVLDTAAVLRGPLGERLDQAVATGAISQDEAQTFREILDKLLAATP